MNIFQNANVVFMLVFLIAMPARADPPGPVCDLTEGQAGCEAVDDLIDSCFGFFKAAASDVSPISGYPGLALAARTDADGELFGVGIGSSYDNQGILGKATECVVVGWGNGFWCEAGNRTTYEAFVAAGEKFLTEGGRPPV